MERHGHHRKRFIYLIAICVYFLGCESYKPASPYNITLTWAENPLNAITHTCTQTIAWRTGSAITDGEVQYTVIEDSSIFEKAVKIKEDSSGIFKTGTTVSMIHTKTIKDLKPGKTYCFRVGSDNNWSSKSTFTTEAENTSCFKFLIFGDSQSGKPNNPDYGKFDTTIHKAYSANPDSRFFINIGDLVEVGGYYNHWEKWFEATNGIINKLSFMPVEGNHETYTDSTEKASSKPFTDKLAQRQQAEFARRTRTSINEESYIPENAPLLARAMPQTEMFNKPAGEGLKNVGEHLGIVAPEFRGDRAKTLNMATGGIPAFVKEDVIPTAQKRRKPFVKPPKIFPTWSPLIHWKARLNSRQRPCARISGK